MIEIDVQHRILLIDKVDRRNEKERDSRWLACGPVREFVVNDPTKKQDRDKSLPGASVENGNGVLLLSTLKQLNLILARVLDDLSTLRLGYKRMNSLFVIVCLSDSAVLVPGLE